MRLGLSKAGAFAHKWGASPSLSFVRATNVLLRAPATWNRLLDSRVVTPRSKHPSLVSLDSTRFATWNANCLATKAEDFLNTLRHAQIDIIALQEVSLTPYEQETFAGLAANVGYKWSRFGELVYARKRLCSLVAIVSRIPFRPITSYNYNSGRFTACAVYRRAAPPLLFASLCAHAADDAARDSLIAHVVTQVTATAESFLMRGDWNSTDEEGQVARLISNLVLHNLDDNIDSIPPATRRDGQRRIYYCLATTTLVAARRNQYHTLSDHHMVAYTLQCDTTCASSVSPLRSNPHDKDVTGADFLTLHCTARTLEAIDAVEVDTAWHLVSDAAERLLVTNTDGALPRADPWTPTRHVPTHKRDVCLHTYTWSPSCPTGTSTSRP